MQYAPEGCGLPSDCATCPSSLLWEEVYPVCSQPLIPLENDVCLVCSRPLIPKRWSLPNVQWAPHPPEKKIAQCATSPSSHLRDEIYPVCSEPLISKRWSFPSVQPAPHASEMRFTQCAVGPLSPRDETIIFIFINITMPRVDYHMSYLLTLCGLEYHMY